MASTKEQNNLTTRQTQILEFIKDEIKHKGFPPSVREIASAVGLSSSATVHSHLSQLEKKGYIKKDPTKPRTIEVLNGSAKSGLIDVPIIGQVAAGSPLLAEENLEGIFSLPEDFINNNSDDVFLLKIKGDSMIGAAILDKDLVLVRRQPTAELGDIVVALVDYEEATVKRLQFTREGKVVLQPENPSHKPIIPDNIEILGKVIGVLRRY